MFIFNSTTTIFALILGTTLAQDWLGPDNQWHPPVEGDVRGACPFINTLANHGLINRNGKDIDLFEMAQIISDTFDLSIMFNEIIAQQAADFGLTTTDADGIVRLDLDDLCRHNVQEHDASLFRNDEFFDEENFCNVDDTLLNDFMRFNPTSDNTTRDEILQLQFNRIVDARTRNPEFTLSEAATLSIAAQYMTLLLLSNDPELNVVEKKNIFTIMLSERIPDGFVPGLIRDPENFEPFFPFSDDRSGEIFPAFQANVEAAMMVPVTPIPPPEVECDYGDDDDDDDDDEEDDSNNDERRGKKGSSRRRRRSR